MPDRCGVADGARQSRHLIIKIPLTERSREKLIIPPAAQFLKRQP
jgi:hypothetical protein